MSFLAPYAFTGAVSLYLSYKTYTSYYSNCEFEEIQAEEIDSICVEEEENNPNEIKEVAKEIVNNIIEDAVQKVKTRDELINEGKMKGDEIKIIIEDINKKEKISYNNIDKLINKTMDKIEEKDIDSSIEVKEDMDKKENNVVLSDNYELPFPEKKKNGKKKKKKRNRK